MRIVARFCFLSFLLILATGAWAQEDAPGVKAKALKEKVEKLSDALNEENKAHFLTIYGNYNLIRTVEIVRGDVDNAVKACGEENPDLKDKIAAKFSEWKGAVNPVIDEARGHLNNMIGVQDYMDAQQIHNLLKDTDETRDAVQGQIEKTPVTSAEACNALHDKMSETQENMVQLLRSTLISLPDMRFAPEEPKKEEAENKAEAVEAQETPAEAPEVTEDTQQEELQDESIPVDENAPSAEEPVLEKQ